MNSEQLKSNGQSYLEGKRMSEIPENIKAILRGEGVSAQCYKRLKDAWPEPPIAPEAVPMPPQPEAVPARTITAAWKRLESAMRMLATAYRAQEKMVRVVEVRTIPEGCVTLKEAERAMIIAATKDALGMHDILAAAKRLGIGKTTLYRKLKEYGLNPVGDNQTVKSAPLTKERIKRLRAEADRLEKLLPAETAAA